MSGGTVRLSMRERAVHTLGPGSRYCIWVQGCNKRCPGCVTPSDQAMDGGYPMSAAALGAEIALAKPDGVTISGGEPFLQAEALAQVLDTVRRVFRYDTGVIVYTGYRLEELRKDPSAAALLARTDLLIDGPYIRELDDGKSLRGSSNQRIIPLTERYNKPEILALYGAPGRETEYIMHADCINCVGVYDHIADPEHKRSAVGAADPGAADPN